jgi:HJR/Mrr/RecB family endonuclease
MQINGDVAGEKRQKLVDQFQSGRGEFDVMILSPRAGGVGLTLTAANHVIHLSRWWNPAVEDQCTDRVYRIGQNQIVHVYYPMSVHPAFSDSSFDELLNTLLDTKRNLSKTMLLPPVNLKQDQKWFSEHLAQTDQKYSVLPTPIEEIDVMEPLEFERWALNRCATIGWEAYRTPKSYDAGADGILKHRHSDARVIIQCKHLQNSDRDCGAEAIDDLLRARACYSGVTQLFALTNANGFSSSAIDRAQKHGINLIGRNQLGQWPQQLL